MSDSSGVGRQRRPVWVAGFQHRQRTPSFGIAEEVEDITEEVTKDWETAAEEQPRKPPGATAARQQRREPPEAATAPPQRQEPPEAVATPQQREPEPASRESEESSPLHSGSRSRGSARSSGSWERVPEEDPWLADDPWKQAQRAPASSWQFPQWSTRWGGEWQQARAAKSWTRTVAEDGSWQRWKPLGEQEAPPAKTTPMIEEWSPIPHLGDDEEESENHTPSETPAPKSTENKTNESSSFARKPKVANSYPDGFSGEDGENIREWKRSLQFWIAGEEPSALPPEVVGPRVMKVLRGKAALICKHLTSEEVAKEGGMELILHTLESSPFIKELEHRRGDQSQEPTATGGRVL